MTGAQLPALALDPDVDQWERQPGETAKRYGQFCTYRDAGRGRTLRKVSETLTISADYVRHVAAAYRWAERAEAWDRYRDQLHEATWLEERRRAAEHDSKVLSAAIGKVADRINSLRPEDFTPETLIRLMDVSLRHRRALFGDPQATIAVTGPAGDPLTVQMAEWAAMAPEMRLAATAGLAAAVLRRTKAIAGGNDDDDE